MYRANPWRPLELTAGGAVRAGGAARRTARRRAESREGPQDGWTCASRVPAAQYPLSAVRGSRVAGGRNSRNVRGGMAAQIVRRGVERRREPGGLWVGGDAALRHAPAA